MQTRYYDEERGGEYNAHTAYNECGNDNDEYTDEYDGCYYYTNDGHHCKRDEYGGYYNEYERYSNEHVGPETGEYETIYPPNDEDSGPTPREGGRGHSIKEMCGIADHTNDEATVVENRKKIEAD